MSDNKKRYSELSSKYLEDDVNNNEIDKNRFIKSKERERKFGNNWEKNKVNLNEIVDKFCPGAVGKTESGVKYNYSNGIYTIKCDKVSGYLRIFDERIKKFVKLDGKPGTRNETHFKIKKRSEM